MNVEELKRHIHSELFGDRFPITPHAVEWKEQRKQAVMQHSVKIMLRHEQSEKDILRMLEDKFFLTEEQAQEFMKKTSSVAKEQ